MRKGCDGRGTTAPQLVLMCERCLALYLGSVPRAALRPGCPAVHSRSFLTGMERRWQYKQEGDCGHVYWTLGQRAMTGMRSYIYQI